MSNEFGPDPREAQLPKWAQARLNLLRMRLREAQREITNLSAEPVSTWPGVPGIYIYHDASNGDNKGRLIQGGRVTVIGHDGLALYVAVKSDQFGPGIYLNGRCSFAVLPVSSNAARILKEDR